MQPEPWEFPVAEGLTLRGDVFGTGARRVLLLPGGGQSRSAWRGTAMMLAQRGYRALTLDLRGQGDSDWAPDGHYGFEDYARDLEVVLACFGAAALVGSSLGGLAALSAAARAPDLTEALVLADVAPRQSAEGGHQVRALMRTATTGFVDVAEAAAAISGIMGTVRRPATDRLRGHLREDGGRLFWKWDPRVIEDRFVDTDEVIDALEARTRRLTMPVLLVHAELSNVINSADVARFRDLVPQCQVETLAGARHMITGESNQAYGEIVARFLARCGTIP